MEKPKNDWPAIIAAYKTSGQNQNAWCRANNVNLNNLRYWLQKEKKAAPAVKKTCQWLELEVPVPQTAAAGQRLTIRIGQANLEINPGFDSQFLTDVIRAIIAAC